MSGINGLLTVSEDRSFLDENGKTIVYSIPRFLTEIVENHNCFICGVGPDAATFNDEHIVPDWILRRYSLHDKRINLPGGSTRKYGQYTVPCYARCNKRMGEVFEEPISSLLSGGFSDVIRQLKQSGPQLLFAWLNLLFLKTHLKDRAFRLNRDSRAESPAIAALYDWSGLHHIHCVARSFHTGVAIAPAVIGSLFVLPAKVGSHLSDFDYVDYYPAQSMLLRIGETLMICTMNDAGGGSSILRNDYAKIAGHQFSWSQGREWLAHVSYANMLLENRPVFYTGVDPNTRALTITADVPKVVHQRDYVPTEYGEILVSVLGPSLSRIPFLNPDSATEAIRQGKYTFLFDPAGTLITDAY